MHPYHVARQVRPSLVLVLLAAATVQAGGQVAGISRPPIRQEQERGRPDFVLRADSPASAILSRRVTVKFTDAPLDRVVNTIARQAGFDVVFEPGAKADKVRVSLERTGTPAAAALLGALDGSGLSALVERGGEVVRIGVATGKGVGARQAGTVTGQVTDARTGAPLGNAEVELDKTSWKATTDTSGRFRFGNVEPGSYRLTVRRLGYAKQTHSVTVAADREDTVNVALEPVITRLDELVTTATGRERRRNVANDITTINADSVMRAAPIHSLTDLLEHRVPGLTVQHTSGAPGDPSRLRIRGAGSPLQNNDPVVVVDGVRVYAKQSDARSANLANGSMGPIGSSQVSNGSGFAAPSPLDYIDMNSVETMEVVKGPAAAALYGPDAANGVIVITTKKGKAGPTRWTMSAAHGRTQMAGRYPDLVWRWGHLPFDGLNVFCPIVATTNSLDDPALIPCVPDSTVSFQMLNDPQLTILDRGHSTDLSLGASGGSQALTYSVTGSYRNELGLVKLPDYEVTRYQTMEGGNPPDWMRRPERLKYWGATSQVRARLGATAEVTLTSALSRTQQQRSTLEQQLSEMMSTFLDRSSGRYYSYLTYDAENQGEGSFTDLTVASYRIRATDVATQLTNRVNANWHARSWLTVTATAGLDVQQRADEQFLPRSRDSLYLEGAGRAGAQHVGIATGQLNFGTGSVLTSTVNATAVALVPLNHGFHFSAASGIYYTGTSVHDIGAGPFTLPYGSSSILNRSGIVTTQNVQDDATFGWSVAPSFGNQKINLDLGLQLTGGSSYGGTASGFHLPSFPKLGFSYLLSDEPFFPLKKMFQSFRVRVAYGRAGRQPGPSDRLRLYNAISTAPGIGDFMTLVTPGNTELRPERSAEFEGGIDADLLDSRLSVMATAYRGTTTDMLMPVSLPPSVYGNAKTLRNVGVLRKTGLNLSVDAQLVRSRALTWSTQVTLMRDRNRVVRLAPGVQPFFTDVIQGTVGTETLTRVAAGYPLFGRWTRPVLGYTDVNGDGLLEREEILLGDTAVYVGAQEPNYQLTIAPSISLWQRALTLTAGLAHDGGVSQMNEVGALLAPFTRGSNDPTVPLAEQLATGKVGFDIPFERIQTVGTTRLDYLSVRYTVPDGVAKRLGAQQLSVAVQGSNLGLWTNYRGLDPNVNAFATGNSVTDAGVLPRPRSWQVQVNATY